MCSVASRLLSTGQTSCQLCAEEVNSQLMLLQDVLNEVERNLHDAMGVARNVALDPRLVPGGGAVEMAVSRGLNDKASTVRLYCVKCPALAVGVSSKRHCSIRQCACLLSTVASQAADSFA